jgi:ABC-type enterochelin transport system permease subunit
MKLKLKGRRFDSIKEIRTVSQRVMKTVKRNDFQVLPITKNTAVITVLIPKGTTSKGMGEDRNFGKWYSYGRGISATFG